MAEVRLDSYQVYAYLTAGWTDITHDVISEIKVRWGIVGTKPTDRLANTGEMTFTLNDYGGEYTPGGASCLTGWKKGIRVKLVMIYDGDPYVRFMGVLDNIRLFSDVNGYTTAEATVLDWLNYAAEHEILTPGLQSNCTADAAINLLVMNMPLKPTAKTLDTGINTLPNVFDIVRKKSTAYSEFAKLVNSELGFLYLAKETGSGEELVFENAQHRSGLTPFTPVPKLTTEVGNLETEAAEALQEENGNNILLNETKAMAFSNNMIDLEMLYGSNTANRLVITCYPRKADASAVTLYQLGRYMEIGAGQTVEFRANYTDPSGGGNVGGFDMVSPVATTDYTVNTASDGTGTDLTSSTVVVVTFGANSAYCYVTNNSTSKGYITLFKLRGKGLYTYAATEFSIQDNQSINQYGKFERSVKQDYQGNLTYGEAFAKTSLYHDRYPQNVLQSITFLANSSSEAMLAFLSYDVGSLADIAETKMGIDMAYFIQGVEVTIEVGGLVWVKWGLVEHWSLLTGTMTSLKVTFSPETRNAINFGYLPQAVQTSGRTYAGWIYRTQSTALQQYTILAQYTEGCGVFIYTGPNYLTIYSDVWGTGTPGLWRTLAIAINQDTLYHFAITLDVWNVNADPIIYIDGTSRTVEELYVPSGSLKSEYGVDVILGNWHNNSNDYGKPWAGYLKDVRIYNRILTSSEVTTLYNSGTPDASLVTSGLVFQGPVVKTRDISLYNSKTLTEDLKVMDNIFQAIGTPREGPTAETWS